jgi:hypothetical protein
MSFSLWPALRAPFAKRLFGTVNQIPSADMAVDNGFQEYGLDSNSQLIPTMIAVGPARGRTNFNNPDGVSIIGVLPSAAAPTVTPTGGTASTWAYKIVARSANASAAASAAGQTTTGAATLTGSAYNTITWTAVPSAIYYDVYRTTAATSPTTTGLIGTVYASAALPTTFVDTGLAGDGSTAPTVNTTGALELATVFDINVIGLAPVQNTVITQIGTAGATNYSYSVSAVTLSGTQNASAAAVQTTTGNATLTSVNANVITFKMVPGARSYNIYRTATSGTPNTTGLIGSVTPTASATLSFTDTGIAGTGTVPTTDGTGSIISSGQVTSSGGVLFAQVPLTAANIIAMNATPVAILAAPGSGKVLVIDTVELQMKPGGTQFTSGGVVTFVYHGGAVTPHASSIPAATINSASATNNQLPPTTAVIQPPTNTGLDITNATAAFATGNGVAFVNIWYSVVTVS